MIELALRLARPGFGLEAALQLPSRGVSAVAGPSGCGKTTLLRALAGLERAQGRVVVDGVPWQDDATGCFVPTHRRGLGYVIQEAALFPHLSVQANLQYGLARTPPAERRMALAQAVELLGITPLMQRAPATLSGGERQRVAIARALAGSPRLLLMDEPLAALDPRRKAEVLPWLERLQRHLALPVVYVSHAMDEVARLADHLVLMEAGRVQASGPLSQVLARLDPPLALGDEAGVVLQGEVAARDAQWQLARLHVPQGPCDFWARDPGQPVGAPVRVRVLARDVSLALTPPERSSIGNQLAGVVDAIADDAHPALALVRVRAGGVQLLAQLTRRSVAALALAPGQPVWALVKSVALLE
ncbi:MULTISPECIES: molybdenum ABC transporter ATP-binding protein [Ramlibacter]|uniref:Molybdenum ABC transporter ATP-binding protein n=1 Tax=Ramlibacter aquaticus TaxID=2780094 RepID=A0ABR9SA57_9BURK|nr:MULTISPECIES: molybdenum ABC transporter ATP-binding protein [Ramlibacter]MBE7939185.1 molybdenum ABC transporter ATP-binding protein [Ramlibacter aquaticus]